MGNKPLVAGSDWRALVGGDLGVADDADHQLVAKRPRLAEGIAVAVVHHVEASVHVNAHGLLLLLLENSKRRPQKAVVEAEDSGPKHDATDQTGGEESGAVEIIQMTDVRTHALIDGGKRKRGDVGFLSFVCFRVWCVIC